VPGASIKMAIAAAVVRSAVMQHCNNAWLIGSGVAPVDLVRIRPRRNHILQLGRGGAKRLRLARDEIVNAASLVASCDISILMSSLPLWAANAGVAMLAAAIAVRKQDDALLSTRRRLDDIAAPTAGLRLFDLNQKVG